MRIKVTKIVLNENFVHLLLSTIKCSFAIYTCCVVVPILPNGLRMVSSKLRPKRTISKELCIPHDPKFCQHYHLFFVDPVVQGQVNFFRKIHIKSRQSLLHINPQRPTILSITFLKSHVIAFWTKIFLNETDAIHFGFFGLTIRIARV